MGPLRHARFLLWSAGRPSPRRVRDGLELRTSRCPVNEHPRFGHFWGLFRVVSQQKRQPVQTKVTPCAGAESFASRDTYLEHKMTAKHRKGKSNHKHDENSLRHDVAEQEARGGHGGALLFVLLLLVVVGGASGAWFCLQQHQSVTHLAESLASVQKNMVKLQTLQEETRNSNEKLFSTESIEQRLHALEAAHALTQRQAGVSATEQLKTSDLSAQVLALQGEMKARLAEVLKDTTVDKQLDDLQSAIRASQEELEVARQELSALQASQSEQANSLARLSEVLATTESRLQQRDKQVEVMERQLEVQAVELLGLKRSLVRHETQLEANAQDIAHVKELLEAENTTVKEQLSVVLQSLKEQSATSQNLQAELQAQMEAVQKQLEKGSQRDVALLVEKTVALNPEEEQADKLSKEEENIEEETAPEDKGEQDEQEMPVSEAQELEVVEGAEAQAEDVQEESEHEAVEGQEQEATEAQEEEAAEAPEEEVLEEQEQEDDGLHEEEFLEENLVPFEEEVQVQSAPIPGSSPLEVQGEAPGAGDEEDDDEGEEESSVEQE
ncbi:neurofilament medium polypeptide-like [Scleropages formosus]|nr:neurofilament medium polypeptide-like [Scleropages formosus]